MAINLVPYGLLPNGNYGINLDNSSGDPRASALEILDTLPSVASSDNFEGRLVYSIDDITMYVYTIDGTSSQWVALEGVPATVGLSDGSATDPKPEVTGSETSGELFWTTDTEVLFVWDGLEWQAAGGRYATTAIENIHEGDGSTVSFSLGVSSTIESSLVEVFIDGVRQNSLTVDPGTGDYSIVGTSIAFVVPPVADAEILTRAFETVQISQTASIFDKNDYASAGQDTFETGSSVSDDNAITVTVDGLTKTLDVDYEVIRQDLTVTSITKASAGAVTATVVTVDKHGIPITDPETVVELGGALEEEYNDSFSVIADLGDYSFEISVLATDPETATADPILWFSPSFTDDKVVFFTPMSGGELVDIKSFKSLVATPSDGEANTLSTISSSTTDRQSIVHSKFEEDLRVKGVAPGTNVSISDNGTDLIISAATGGNFENRVGINAAVYDVGETTSYVGVLNSTVQSASINLGFSGSGGAAPTEGRKITIKDEDGGAGTNNIIIQDSAGGTFEGAGASYTIAVNRGSVTLVLGNANNWNITAEKI